MSYIQVDPKQSDQLPLPLVLDKKNYYLLSSARDLNCPVFLFS